MRPDDVSCLKPIKTKWKLYVLTWQNLHLLEPLSKDILKIVICNLQRYHLLEPLTKRNFAPAINVYLENFKNIRITIINGFRVNELFILDPEVVNYNKCLSNDCQNLKKTNIVSSTTVKYDNFNIIVTEDRVSV